MDIHTHLAIDHGLCGRIVQAGPPLAIVEIDLIDTTKSDDRGLVHGGETLRFEGRVDGVDGRTQTVSVTGRTAAGMDLFAGSFTCFVAPCHVFDR